MFFKYNFENRRCVLRASFVFLVTFFQDTTNTKNHHGHEGLNACVSRAVGDANTIAALMFVLQEEKKGKCPDSHRRVSYCDIKILTGH